MKVQELKNKIAELKERGHTNSDMVVSILNCRLQNLKEKEEWNKVYKIKE